MKEEKTLLVTAVEQNGSPKDSVEQYNIFNMATKVFTQIQEKIFLISPLIYDKGK